jgi:DNA repair protein RadC
MSECDNFNAFEIERMTAKRGHKGDGHRQRLRDRFLQSGLGGFHDYEVIELLLSLSTPRRDCKDAAKAALKRFRTLQGVLEAAPQELCQVPGIGPKNLVALKLIRAAADRYLAGRITHKDPLNNSRQLFDYLYHHLWGKSREHFKVIFLDARNRVLTEETLFKGTLTASSVYPREVIKAALHHQAAALIFAHNHPSGDPSPSADDLALTRQLFLACRAVGITVHEHIVIGEGRYFSFADEGTMERLRQETDAFLRI